ncbi:MAG: ImmA/IrrE family metallo-endopeptidase, partial [Firmicutes bacterium]|nr:ImmA/IrrE family metallo-endopeptidase [Bacillota bacterium]
MLRHYKYDEYLDSPQQLANRIIDRLQEENEITFPIDPFKLLSKNGIIYQFRDFKELEGIYIAPVNQEDIPIVGINYNRPITRQRFTAAHELCHHIKDRSNEACPIGGQKDKIEKFADQFASELLMPREYFEAKAREYLNNGYVTLDDALKLSVYFGVSFESCVFTLAYRCKFIEGNMNSPELRKIIRKYKPQNKLAELGLSLFDPCLREQIINSYTYFYNHDFNLIWNIFKNDYIYNESRIEGSRL